MESRKEFLRKLGVGTAAAATSGFAFPWIAKASSSNREEWIQDTLAEFRTRSSSPVRFGLIGAGGMGQGDMMTALRLPGTSIVAACDLYKSRLERCKERWGQDLFTTTDYRKVLERDDVDAVIVATTDHWHERITAEALRAGKPVYLEKPMVQHVDEGQRLIEVARQTEVPLLIGSQRTSSILFERARELFESGAIGNLNFVEGYWDRYSAIGAWQYSIPPSATPRNVDWERYREGLPKKAFDAKEFFRWRNYDDYGTGVAGDLFVHLFSGLHLITGAVGPDTIMASGGLRYWHDGRNAEDVVLGLYHYAANQNHPEFTLSLRVNFADGSGGGSRTRLVGDEGELTIGWDRLTLKKAKLSDRPGKSTGDLGENERAEYDRWYEENFPEGRAEIIEPTEFVYRAPEGYDDRLDHFANFLAAVRDGAPITQDAVFGLRAAGPAVLTSQSLRTKSVVNWDPVSMKLI